MLIVDVMMTKAMKTKKKTEIDADFFHLHGSMLMIMTKKTLLRDLHPEMGNWQSTDLKSVIVLGIVFGLVLGNCTQKK